MEFFEPTPAVIQKEKKYKMFKILSILFFLLFVMSLCGLIALAAIVGTQSLQIDSLTEELSKINKDLTSSDNSLTSTIEDYEDRIATLTLAHEAEVA